MRDDNVVESAVCGGNIKRLRSLEENGSLWIDDKLVRHGGSGREFVLLNKCST